MFLACVELSTRDDRDRRQQQQQGRYAAGARVIELEFPHFETAKIWAEQEASRHQDATGNAAVFQTMGPFVSLAWEHDVKSAADLAFDVEHPGAHRDELVQRA